MAGFGALSQGAKAAIFAGGAAVAALVGYAIYSTNAPAVVASLPDAKVNGAAQPPTDPVQQPISEPSQVQAIDPEPAVAAPEVAAKPQPDAEPQPNPAQTALSPIDAPLVPSFDVVRVEPDGTTVVAGRADPNAKVILRVDGAEIMSTEADANGNFAAFFVLESSDKPRMLTMVSILPDQTEVPAGADVALAPTTAPVAIAAAEPQVEAAPADASANAPALADTPAEPALPDAPAALLVTKDGVKVLQSGDQPGVGPATELSIDTISYTPSGDVQLSGRGGAGGVLRIYLDNAPLVDAAVASDGAWSLTLPPVDPGLYTLRVDQLAADGSVTARFETPFKRETAAALAASAAQTDPATAEQPSAETVVAAAEPDAAPGADNAAPVADLPAEGISDATPAPDTTATADPTPTLADPAVPTPAAISITVQPGFTLWGIASKQFGDGVMYVQVFEANKDKIRDPNLIYPGQVFVIPTVSE